MLLITLPLTGCVTFPPLKMSGVDATNGSFVEDRTKPDSYPGFGFAEGNIYSCRYGIRHIGQARYVPSKAVIFGALLVESRPEIATHRVVLDQFDVYQNYRLRSLSGTRSMGGAI
ncbi:hypothetical protein, partial [Dokdonella sp.]|uniref:hypothetical protein n=1 Tax=Dokdonella sp. TaxID=2291710 RepID=UPI003C5B10F9